MGFTPNAVHENATPDPNEVLVSGTNAEGLPQNVLLRRAAAIRDQLIATPPVIPNPDHVAVSAELASASAAADTLTTQLAATPDDDPNHGVLSARAEAAIATVASLADQVAELQATLPNPDRTPIEEQAFDAAIAQMTPPPASAAP